MVFKIISDVVIGVRYGDEGKGKVTDYMLRNNHYDLCVRYGGGPNAGHTVIVECVTYDADNNPINEKKKMATHQVPSGALSGVMSIINANCMVDLDKLQNELEYIQKELPHLDVFSTVKIDRNCCVIEKKHIEEDKANDNVGSTHCGMMPSYRDKFARKGTRISSLKDEHPLLSKVELIDMADFVKKFAEQRGSDVYILFEGAQGFELGINSPNYPYVTSDQCTAGSAFSYGISPKTVRNVVGICKLYDTYVGKMKFQPEEEIFTTLQKLGHEFGVTTGRARQCNWLNLDALLRSVFSNGIDTMIINKCDIVRELGVYKIIRGGIVVDFNNFQSMIDCIEIELKMAGVEKVVFSYSPETV